MTIDTFDRKYALGVVLAIIFVIIVNLFVHFNWIDFGYLLFVGTCFIRYHYINKNE